MPQPGRTSPLEVVETREFEDAREFVEGVPGGCQADGIREFRRREFLRIPPLHPLDESVVPRFGVEARVVHPIDVACAEADAKPEACRAATVPHRLAKVEDVDGGDRVRIIADEIVEVRGHRRRVAALAGTDEGHRSVRKRHELGVEEIGPDRILQRHGVDSHGACLKICGVKLSPILG